MHYEEEKILGESIAQARLGLVHDRKIFKPSCRLSPRPLHCGIVDFTESKELLLKFKI